MIYWFLGFGAWLLYFTVRGVVPNSPALWGKDKSGQKMGPGRRILFGFGGILFLGLGVLIYLIRSKKI